MITFLPLKTDLFSASISFTESYDCEGVSILGTDLPSIALIKCVISSEYQKLVKSQKKKKFSLARKLSLLTTIGGII